MDDTELLDAARDACENAYAPYSAYRVGAALRTADGAVYVGANVENANYSNSLHAEEVALGSAVRDGHDAFERLVVTSAARDGVTPCGMCRQTFVEFCDDDFPIYCDTGDGVERHALGDLIPETITAANLDA
ncbi:cytidine deaminase [Halarchaeum acidiphilum MH1-52-1]|uniref:cytidine deaminase n=1 Tax=Halarchaeum acidiphilum MH1-52-1 TaxID=1261545 RepID=U3ADY5_9EURY|nr:cytidine deaminase [Halarchaeum acidiphilum]GAD52983.1 cytidine deaminase [Halarchaeum acidiphilum MH1-52-1]